MAFMGAVSVRREVVGVDEAAKKVKLDCGNQGGRG